MRVFRLLSFRRLRQQPLRAVIAMVAVAAAVALAVAILITGASVEQSVRDFGRSLAGPAELRILGATPRTGLEQAAVDRAAAVEGVSAVVPMIQVPSRVDFFPAGAAGADGGRAVEVREENVLVLGVDCTVQALLGLTGCDQAMLDAAPDGVFAVGPGLAADAGTEPSMRTNTGRVALTGRPVLEGLSTINEGRVVVLSLAVAQQRFGQAGYVDIAYVVPVDDADLDAVRGRLDDVVGEQNEVLGADDPPPEVELALQAFLPLFSLLGLFGLGTGGVLVRNTVALSLEERRRQLAITAALGADGRTLVGGAVGEAAVLGLIGGLLGAGAGALVAGPLVSGVSEFTESISGAVMVRHVQPSAIVIGAVLGALVGAVAALGPARRAAKLDVAAELSGRSAVAEAKPFRVVRRLAVWSCVGAVATFVCWLSRLDGGIEPWQATVGPPAFLVVTISLLLGGAALTPLLLGWLASTFAGTKRATWLLSFAELVRDPRRVGIMAVAVASPVVTGFATEGFVSSARAAIERDFDEDEPAVSISTIGVNDGIDAFVTPEMLDRVAALPEVGEVQRARIVSAGQESGELLGVHSYDDADITDAEYLKGEPDVAGFEAGEVLIGPGLARRTGARPGDTVEVPTPSGVVDLPVQGIIDNGDAAGYAVVVHRDRFTELYGDRPPAWVVLRPAAGTSEQELATAVRSADPPIDPALRVTTTDQLTKDIVESIDAQMLPFRAMQQSLTVVAFVAVISTLLLAGLQRQREHGLLAAVGAEPGALGRMVLAEAGMVGVAAILNSLVAGPIVLWSMLQVIPLLIGVHNPFEANWGAFAFGAIGSLIVTMLAAAWPAWRAGRVEVLDALRYE